jgi:hypothetical protein
VRRAGHTDPAFSHGAGSGFDVPPRTRRSLVAATCPDVRQGKVCAEATHGPRARAGPTGRRPQAGLRRNDRTARTPGVAWGPGEGAVARARAFDLDLLLEGRPFTAVGGGAHALTGIRGSSGESGSSPL